MSSLYTSNETAAGAILKTALSDAGHAYLRVRQVCNFLFVCVILRLGDGEEHYDEFL